MQIVTFEEKHQEEAAGLVQDRYKVLRQRQPVMPERYAQIDPLLEMLGELGREANGVAAYQAGKLVGFLAGLVIPEFMGKRAAYSPAWANGAVLEGGRRIYEEMYACQADQWLADSCNLHLVSLLSSDISNVQDWQWLGFGLVNVDAVCGVTKAAGGAGPAVVRQASAHDDEVISQFGKALERHVAAAPTFFTHTLEDFGERLKAADITAWLAFQEDQAVGFIAVEAGEYCGCEFLQDEKTVNIAGAYVLENYRGMGTAAALVNQALNWARAQGYQRCAVDFETANPLAARFWLHWFQPAAYSLLRWVDERL